MAVDKRIRYLLIGTTILGFLLTMGCATTNGNLTNDKIAQGDKSIRNAKEKNADLYAPVELKTAESKLNQAKASLTEKDYEKASRLADEASMEAEYARVKASSENTKKAAEEMRMKVEALRKEIGTLEKQ